MGNLLDTELRRATVSSDAFERLARPDRFDELVVILVVLIGVAFTRSVGTALWFGVEVGSEGDRGP
jgi:hypothetical protein